MTKTVRFYFDYISSNAYLAWIRLPELAAKYGYTVEPVPVLFAGLLEALAPFRTAGGGYRLENEWHTLVATA